MGLMDTSSIFKTADVHRLLTLALGMQITLVQEKRNNEGPNACYVFFKIKKELHGDLMVNEC